MPAISLTDLNNAKTDVDHIADIANSIALMAIDRLGNSKRTLAGIQAAADMVLAGLGYAPPVAYAAGISLTLSTQTVSYSGATYAPKADQIPFTTSGIFETAKFRLIQGVSGADLAAVLGATLVGRGAGTVASALDSIDGSITGINAALADIVAKAYGDVTFVATGGDDSAALQALIDAHKGKNIVVKGACTFAGVLLSGATYNNTRLTILHHKMKVRPNVGTTNFYGNYVGLIFKDVDGVQLDYFGDGQRTLQPDEEHTHLIVIAGGKNYKFGRIICTEIRADGIYITQSIPNAESATPENIVINDFIGYNSNDDGRNSISVIAGKKINVGTFTSIGVGGVVGGFTMPGGFDIEPNFSYQPCEDIHIGTAFIRGQGTANFGISGKDAGSENYCVKRVSVGHLDCINTHPTPSAGRTAAVIMFVDGIDVRGTISMNPSATGTSGYGIALDKAIHANIDLTISDAYIGANIGYAGWVRKSHITLKIQRYGYIGIQAIGITESDVDGSVRGAINATTFAVVTRSNSRALTQDKVNYSVDCPYDGVNARGYRNELTDLASFTNCKIRNCNVSGYSTPANGIDGLQTGIVWENVSGYLDAAAKPTAGAWPIGHFVRNGNPAKDANNMTVFGWQRVTAGTAHVDGTDWYTCRVSLVSPAV